MRAPSIETLLPLLDALVISPGLAGALAITGAVVLAIGVKVISSRRSSEEPWTRGDAKQYLASSELYDVEELKELGLYDDLLEAVSAGNIAGERAFEHLCDQVVAKGKDWEDVLEDEELDDVGRSWRAHQDAKERPPPVEVGERVELGVVDFQDHHSGTRHAVGKVEGFVVFVEDIPDDLAEGDVVRAKIMYHNRGKTSASARFLERVG